MHFALCQTLALDDAAFQMSPDCGFSASGPHSKMRGEFGRQFVTNGI